MQAVAAAYARAFLDAGAHWSWAHEACLWVAEQHPGKLLKEFAKGRTLLALALVGRSRLVEPYLKVGAKRADRLMLAQLNLEAVYNRVLQRIEELAERLAREERLGREARLGRAKRRAWLGKPSPRRKPSRRPWPD
jgi:hypothetical protein